MTNATAKVIASKSTAGFIDETFGGQAAQMLGAAEHRSERIR